MSEGELRARIRELEALLLVREQSQNTPQIMPATTVESRGASSAERSVLSAACTFRLQKLFLDSEIKLGTDKPTYRWTINVPSEILATIGNTRHRTAVTTCHFGGVHHWMPIISKVHLDRMLKLQSHDNPRADFALLLLSMQVLQRIPRDATDALNNAIYLAAKDFLYQLENSATQSLMKLQATILLAVYEIGHAIFPAAYITVGYCATQALALGLHDRRSPQLVDPPKTWIEWEECTRVWWMIMFLDRYDQVPPDNQGLL